MATSAFKILSEIFKKNDIKCILIGGYAVNSYKVTRHTADIDFLLTEEAFEKIKQDLFANGYTVKHIQDVFVQLVNTEGLRDLDFMFTDSNTFNKLFENSNVATIAGEQFNIPSFENMLALKLHSIKYNPHRELHDLPDIVNLIRVNNYKYKTDHFRMFCEKFGNSSLYCKILEYLEGTTNG